MAVASFSSKGRTRPLETSINYGHSLQVPLVFRAELPSHFSLHHSSFSTLHLFAPSTVIPKYILLDLQLYLAQLLSYQPSIISNMTLTDEELDRDWQPSGRRPQSFVSPYTHLN
jgi:hypothetical protein